MTMIPKMIWPGVEQRLAVGDHVADAGRRADQLGDDHVGPRPAEHEPQRLGDRRRGGRQQHAPHDAAGVGAERVRRLDQVAPRRADRHRDHQHDLEERADEDDEQLLRLADAGPQDQQRDERGGRQVARERDERLEERLDRLVRAHRDAERHRDERRQHEAADDAPDRDADVPREAVAREQVPAFAQHRQRIGEERLRHEAAERDRRPDRDEQREEGDAQHGAPPRARSARSGVMRARTRPAAPLPSADELRVGELAQVRDLLDDADLEQQVGGLLAELPGTRRRRISGSPPCPASAGTPADFANCSPVCLTSRAHDLEALLRIPA